MGRKLTNYIEGRNPFGLSRPPEWWLNGLFCFDRDIVVMPSQTRIGVYWITRHKRFSIGLTPASITNEVKAEDTDTAKFVLHKVEPVTDICTPCGIWSLDKLLQWLAARDTWADEDGPLDAAGIAKAWANGGSRYTKRVEQEEAEAEVLDRKNARDLLYHSTGDGWRSLQARTGQRILNAGPATRAPEPLIVGV